MMGINGKAAPDLNVMKSFAELVEDPTKVFLWLDPTGRYIDHAALRHLLEVFRRVTMEQSMRNETTDSYGANHKSSMTEKSGIYSPDASRIASQNYGNAEIRQPTDILVSEMAMIRNSEHHTMNDSIISKNMLVLSSSLDKYFPMHRSWDLNGRNETSSTQLPRSPLSAYLSQALFTAIKALQNRARMNYDIEEKLVSHL